MKTAYVCFNNRKHGVPKKDEGDIIPGILGRMASHLENREHAKLLICVAKAEVAMIPTPSQIPHWLDSFTVRVMKTFSIEEADKLALEMGGTHNDVVKFILAPKGTLDKSTESMVLQRERARWGFAYCTEACS